MDVELRDLSDSEILLRLRIASERLPDEAQTGLAGMLRTSEVMQPAYALMDECERRGISVQRALEN